MQNSNTKWTEAVSNIFIFLEHYWEGTICVLQLMTLKGTRKAKVPGWGYAMDFEDLC
jgi:hypothetical protein